MALSTRQVLSILETSAKSGVHVLKFRDLHITFGQKPEPADLPDPPKQPSAHHPVAAMTEQQHTIGQQLALEEQEFNARQAQLEELQLTNPSLYEQLVNNGELEEDDDESGDESE